MYGLRKLKGGGEIEAQRFFLKAAIVASAQDWSRAQTVGKPAISGSVTGLDTVAKRAAESGASEHRQNHACTVLAPCSDRSRSAFAMRPHSVRISLTDGMENNAENYLSSDAIQRGIA